VNYGNEAEALSTFFEDEEWHVFDMYNELVSVVQELKLTVANHI
jgi:hypothetical protein